MLEIVKKALNRFKEVNNSLECECDNYNGYVCTIHRDNELIENALKFEDRLKLKIDFIKKDVEKFYLDNAGDLTPEQINKIIDMRFEEL